MEHISVCYNKKDRGSQQKGITNRPRVLRPFTSTVVVEAITANGMLSCLSRDER